jgi:molybdopterin adenylyltransferase
MDPVRLAILTVSDAASRGEREDTSGDAIERWGRDAGHVVVAREVTPDEHRLVLARLEAWADGGDAIDLVLTTGGTGFTDRDVTPEATRQAIEREAPGIAEAIRLGGAGSTPFAWLSRGVAGIRGRTLIVNLPGSTGGVRDGLRVLEPLVPHAVQLLAGEDTHRHPDHG